MPPQLTPSYMPLPTQPPSHAPRRTFAGLRVAALIVVTVALSTLLPATLPSAAATARVIAYPKPAITIQLSGPSSTLRTGDAIQFSVDVQSGHDLTFVWNFAGNDSATGAVVIRQFSDYGQVDVSVIATDPIGQTAEASTQVAIYPPPPTAAFIANVENLSFYYYATFDASGSSGTDIQSYDWDFGDGGSDTTGGPQDAHYYSAAGAYTVTLTVTDGAGQRATVSNTVIVQ